MTSQIKRIIYADCDKQGHQTEPLSRICFDQTCNNKTLVCSLCEEQQHKSHKTCPLKKFLQKAQIQSNLNQQELNPYFYANRIDELRSNYFNIIAQQKKLILDQINDLQIQGTIYFNKLQNTTVNLISLDNPFQFINKHSSNSKHLKSYFAKMLAYLSLQQKDGLSLKKKLDLIVDTCADKQKKLIQSFTALQNEFQKNIQKILSSLDATVTFKSPQFEWSQQLKGLKVKITDAIAQQTNMQSSGQRFALIEPSLSQYGNKKKQCWGIKVKKFVGWIGLGICLKNAIKLANYHFNYTNIGHGSYLISSNGYSWSHSVKEFNSAFKTFQFTVNDVVYIEYDPEGKKLRFRKNQGPQKFQLDIVPPPYGDSYHPCVNLCSTGDSVQIILPGMQLS